MLKRLRPVSPPPSGPSIPLVSDPAPSHRREPKRRRILPPSLDGQSRHSMFRTDEDDGEEDDDELNLLDGRNPSGSGSVHNIEYQSANTVLHDLHALHRHRLIFSSPSSSYLMHPDSRGLHSPVKSYVPPIPDYSRGSDDTQDTSGRQAFGCELPFEEVQSVKERYEDTNSPSPLSSFSISILCWADSWVLCFSLGESSLTNTTPSPHNASYSTGLMTLHSLPARLSILATLSHCTPPLHAISLSHWHE
ncbi:hypothetical protein B0H17DRAFT_629033 [Mycena rosella]|uniref:Uncharacterized protein n=1 Tax=Mycena rosella TaxID=1033263 RepID=A0AAD7GW23_MYCRO|nr:hypothetical protein B0H17DRAFT_629033 [Mycena rosella]